MKTNKDMTIRTLLAGLAAVGATSLLALPSIDQQSVTLSQNPRNRLVTVRYVLTGDPAVVTIDFQTNNVATGAWASIGGDRYSRVIGDVNMLVTNVNSTCTIFWQPVDADAWPNQYLPGDNFRAVVKAWATNAPPPYMIVDLQDNPGQTRYYPSAGAVPGGITNDLYKTTRLAFRLVPASAVQWRMGAPTTEVGQKYDSLNYASRETPHLVTFTNDWYMGVYPVTQRQHAFFQNTGKVQYPSTVTNNMPATSTYPVESVCWADIRGWHMSNDPNNSGSKHKGDWPNDGHEVAWNSNMYKARAVTGLPSLDLPTEAMWEYSCRADTATATYAGNLTVSSSDASASDPMLDEIAWYSANSGGVTHPVGLKKPNAWGLYDMIGNVREWCLDRYDTTNSGRMSSDAVIDPWGPVDVGGLYPNRLYRGGFYNDIAYASRAAFRASRSGHDTSLSNSPYLKTIGYRLCCEAMALK